MSQKSENEFENLFKRAADQYPINSSNADWSVVLRELQKDKKKRGLFWLNKKTYTLILLILSVGISSSLITGLIFWNSSVQQKSNQNDLNRKNNTQQNAASEKKMAADVYEKVMIDLKNTQSLNAAKENKDPTSSKNKSSRKLNTNFIKLKAIKPTANNPLAFVNANEQVEKNTIRATIETNKSEPSKTKDESHTLTNIIHDSTAVTVEKKGIDSKINEIESNISTIKNKNLIRIRNGSNFFYVGILYALDKSSIQLEPNKGMGYSWAITLGYHLNKKWSFETGLHIEKKELYTTGANFDKTTLGATGNILWIESEKNLIEIPLTLKRDIFQQNRHSVFATIGLSSYIVNKETNEYEEDVSGAIQTETVVFNKNISTIFSTLNFSLGYQYKLGKIGNIRIEPYFNLPIGVIGKSKTPIISKGIFIGWTFDLHKNLLKQ